MSKPAPVSLIGLVSDQLALLEQFLAQEKDDSLFPPTTDASADAVHPIHGPDARPLDTADGPAPLIFRALRHHVDRLTFLYEALRALSSSQNLPEALARMVDIIWQREQYSFAVVVLGETELGPYFYYEMRGIMDPRRFLGKQCPLPLWGELAHALVRRLDPQEADYLIIEDVAATGRPKAEEFPWMEREGSLMILPLRDESVAIGALLLGRRQVNGFEDPELCAELVEITTFAARIIIATQMQQELQERADQLVGLQLFTRSISARATLPEVLNTIIDGVAELMGCPAVALLLHIEMIGAPLAARLDSLHDIQVYQDLVIAAAPLQLDPSTHFSKLYRLVMWTIDAVQPLFFDPAEHVESPEDLYYNEGGRALLVPVMAGDNPLGAIYVEASAGAHDFEEGDMVVLRTAANAVAIVLDRFMT